MSKQAVSKEGPAERGLDKSVNVPLGGPDVKLNVAQTAAVVAAKPQVKLADPPEHIEKLIEIGIPVRKAVFHRTVLFDYAGGTPESAYYSPEWSQEMKKHKQARMWYTPHGLVCEQNGMWKVVPLANVSDTIV